MTKYTIDEWMRCSRAELASVVRQYKVALKMGMDGTTRHYLLTYPNAAGQVTDFAHYAEHGRHFTFEVLDRLFGCGIQTIMILNIWPTDIKRKAQHVRDVVQVSSQVTAGEAQLVRYQEWDTKVALYGNYDIHDDYAPVRNLLMNLNTYLTSHTEGDNLLLWGYLAGTGLDETIARSVLLYQQLGRAPTEEEVRLACFPHGPDHLDLFIGSSWLRVGNEHVPPVLNLNSTDIYNLYNLPLDMTEVQIRRILYDHLFRRHVSRQEADLPNYSDDELRRLREYYETRHDQVFGIGRLVADKFWYPLD